jgi:hypothetical protein
VKLSPEEQRTLDRVLAAESESGAPAVSFRELVAGWESFVRQVERGYDGSIYEYTNDLSIRDRLQRVLAAAPADLARRAADLLGPADERFQAATRPSIRPVAPGVRGDRAAWWFRVPLKLLAELEEDLRSEGVIR